MEAIDTKAIKDAVAQNHNYRNWKLLLIDAVDDSVDDITLFELEQYENEVISEVAKQVAERQREICADTYNNATETNYSALTEELIQTAPSPEIK